jgi:signal recognition particle receptor subunit beta
MVSDVSDVIPQAVKILVAGGFGVGKTTMVAAVSEIAPLSTEELLTEAGVGVDDLAGIENKRTTTVALDFGCLGAVVLADTRRLDACFPSIDFFERRGVPFVIAVNCFDGAARYDIDEVRDALDVGPDTPIALCDARDRDSAKEVMVTLVEYVLRRQPASRV